MKEGRVGTWKCLRDTDSKETGFSLVVSAWAHIVATAGHRVMSVHILAESLELFLDGRVLCVNFDSLFSSVRPLEHEPVSTWWQRKGCIDRLRSAR